MAGRWVIGSLGHQVMRLWQLSDLKQARIGKTANRRLDIKRGGSEISAKHRARIQPDFVALHQGSSRLLRRVTENDDAPIEIMPRMKEWFTNPQAHVQPIRFPFPMLAGWQQSRMNKMIIRRDVFHSCRAEKLPMTVGNAAPPFQRVRDSAIGVEGVHAAVLQPQLCGFGEDRHGSRFVDFGRIAVAGVEQHLLVVAAQKECVGILPLDFQHSLHCRARIFAAINVIAQKQQRIALVIEALVMQQFEQGVEHGNLTVNITDGVNHGAARETNLQVADVAVGVVHENGFGCQWFVGQAKRGNNDFVAGRYAMRSGSINNDFARSVFFCNHIRFKSLSVRDIPNMDKFIGNQLGAFDEIAVNGDAADVIDVRMGNRRTMNFAFQEGKQFHNNSLYPVPPACVEISQDCDDFHNQVGVSLRKSWYHGVGGAHSVSHSGGIAAMSTFDDSPKSEKPAADSQEILLLFAKWNAEQEKNKRRSRRLKALAVGIAISYVTFLSFAMTRWDEFDFLEHPWFFWGSLLLLPAMGVYFLFASNKLSADQKKLIDLLALANHRRAVPALLTALTLPNVDALGSLFLALKQSLPQLKASDAGLLDAQQRITLYQTLSARTFAIPLWGKPRMEYQLTALKAVEQIGDETAVVYLRAITEDHFEHSNVQDAAKICLQAVQQRNDERRQSQTLLRASHETKDNSTLLRPAMPHDVDQDNLLRPVIQ